ncbi:MAG: nucleotidyltransferase substrate binding protein [Alistipes sp.]|nr:nucleotidyltransferase substrate binding protein [Alistipes sp.]
MDNQDIRWEQRFSNFRKAFNKLSEAVKILGESRKMEGSASVELIEDEMLQESLVKRFEYTHELAWKVMKDYADYQGKFDIKGARDATREAFSMNLIADGNLWMDMIKSRNLTVHTYDEGTVHLICGKIMEEYYPAFCQFDERMSELTVNYQKE